MCYDILTRWWVTKLTCFGRLTLFTGVSKCERLKEEDAMING